MANPASFQRAGGLQQAWERSLATGQPFERTLPLRGKDGNYRWFLTRIVPIHNEAGALVRWVGISTDIDDLRREREMREILDRTSTSAVSTPDYADTLDRVARAAVPKFAAMCTVYVKHDSGRIEQEAVAHVDDETVALIRGLHQATPLEPSLPYGYPEVIRSGRSQLIVKVDDGFYQSAARSEAHLDLMRRVPVRSMVIVPLTVSGRTFGAMAFATTDHEYDTRDVAFAEELGRRAALVIESARLYREANRANQAKDDFLALLGHELRNPLAPIVTGIKLMRIRGAGANARELGAMERQAQHLIRLVDDLMDVARIANGKVALVREHVEVAAVLADAIETASPSIEHGKHTLELDVPTQGLVVSGDPARLKQVFTNLLTNAAKYTPAGGLISVRARAADGNVVIEVTDNGIGIAAELLPSIFELFVQARQSLARSQGGLGLGLTLVKNLVRVHGGTVTVRSDGLNHGSRFTVTIPAVSAPTTPPPPSTQLSPVERQSAGRILIVDDNKDAAQVLSEALVLYGYRTLVAHDGPSALAAVESEQPDVALLDIGLPIMDGFELARRLSQLLGPSLTLIAVTGYAQATDRERAAACGFSHHVAKPVDIEQLVRLMRQSDHAKSFTALAE